MEGHAIWRTVHIRALRLLLAASWPVWAIAFSASALARTSGGFPDTLPNATITSDETNTTPNPEAPVDEGAPPAATVPPPVHHSYPRHHANMVEPSYAAAVEPTHALLKLNEDAWAYSQPETSSRTLERVHAAKFLNVTGSTHYYLQVKLTSGQTGYVPISAVELTHPEDKIMRLSTDAGVVSQPNRYGQKLSEVHQGHDVHVVGVAMNYMKIRMKNGLEGYIPMTAAE